MILLGTMQTLTAAEMAMLASVLGALAMLWRVYSAINKAKGALVEEVKKQLRADGDGSERVELIKQPVRIEMQKEFMTRDEHRGICGHLETRTAALEARMGRVERKMEDDKIEIIQAGEERARQIHERINTVLAAVSELKGEIKHLAK